MRFRERFRRFRQPHDGLPQGSPLATPAAADHITQPDINVPNVTHLHPSRELSPAERTTPRRNSARSQNTLPIFRVPSSDRRIDHDPRLGSPISTSPPEAPFWDSPLAPVRQESGLIKTGAQLVSNKVDCVVILIYKGKAHRAIEEPIHWLDRSQYASFDYAADRWLRDFGVPHQKQLYRKSGQCRLIAQEDKDHNFEFDSRTLENEEQWFEVLQILITSFVSKHPYVKFHLEICWEYSDVTIEKVEYEKYSVTVRNAIHEKLRFNWENQQFIPRKDLDEIMSKGTINELINSDTSLNDLSRTEKDKFISDVALDATRLLAVCVFVKLPLACLHTLMTQGYKDTDMPLTRDHCPHRAYNVDFGIFLTWQGGFIAHQFEKIEGRPKHEKIPDDVVVPITLDEVKPNLGEGGFGVVYSVRIDPDHHVLSQDRNSLFALKIFKEFGSQTERDFNIELDMLNTLSEADHPHITPHLASWTQKKRFYMLFPRAETNMGQFLRTRPHIELSNANVGWLLSQLKGLADGVRRIHNLGPAGLGPEVESPRNKGRSGFHHDLKPENILVFAVGSFKGQDPPISQLVLKISDFGAARINVILSQSGMGKVNFSPKHSNLPRGDPVYSAPDFELGEGTSRPYDIWSLGCVFLETLLWTFGLSNSNLDTFRTDRLTSHNSRSDKFWHQDERSRKVILKDAVVLRLKQLQEYCRGRGIFERLVRLTAKMLTITPKDRPKAPDICNELDAMELQAKQDFRKHDFYRHDISTYVEIAAPPTATDNDSRRPSIDERSIYADENGLLPVRSHEQRRPNSPSNIPDSIGRRLDNQNGDDSKDPYRLSPISTDIPPVPGHSGHSRSPSIAISDHDAPLTSPVIMNGAVGHTQNGPLGSHSVEIGRDDLVRPSQPST